jgi:hypothetical protein
MRIKASWYAVRRMSKKSESAALLGKLGGKARVRNLTPEELSAANQKASRAAAVARMKKISPKKRSKLAKQAAVARWAKQKPKSTA